MTHRGAAGFTIVEALVVLVIVGIASVLLTQGLGQIFQTRARLGPYIDKSEDAARIGEWFRRILGGAMPDTQGGSFTFSGTGQQIQGLTTMPMGMTAGAPTPFRMELGRGDSDLNSLRISGDFAPTLDLFTWRNDQAGAERAQFSYFDGTSWVDHWPIEDFQRRFQQSVGSLVQVQPPQLPKLIRLQATLGGRPWVLIASPRGPDTPIPKLSDLFGR